MALNLRGLFGKFSSSNSVVATFSVNNTTASLLAPTNIDRLKAVITNDTGTLFVKEGLLASSTSYTYKMGAGERVTIDSSYTGPITAIKSSGTTSVFVTVIS